MSLDKKLIALGPAAPATRTADLGSNPFGDGNCICWIEFDTSITDGTSTQTLTANGSITLTTDQVIYGTTSGYFDATGAKDIANKDSITFAAGDGGRSDLDGWTNSNDLSLSVWIYWEGLNQPSNEQAVATILAITNGTGIMCRIYWNNHGTYPNKLDLGSYSDGIQSDTALNINAWNHLVFISPATNSSTESAEIYLNGTRVGYKTNWARGSRNYYDSIGGEFNTVNSSSQYFNGYMDNLRIFKDRLTVSEVEDLYNEGLSPTYADFLVVAGGGSGHRSDDNNGAGGGGAGGLRTSYGSTSGGGAGNEPRLTLISGTTYTITVGAGGADNSTPEGPAISGSDSSIAATGLTTITSLGGGGGGGIALPAEASTSGGSGGGGAGYNSGAGAAGTTGQGFAGGNGSPSTSGIFSERNGGGGGGAGSVGTNGSTSSAGAGGSGLSVSITGSSVGYAGGGSGGNKAGSGVTSSDGGGTGAGTNGIGTAGAVNTGGGGGGGGVASYAGKGGGSGIVILRLATSIYTGTTTGSPTVTTDGSDTIIKFTGSGTYVH